MCLRQNYIEAIEGLDELIELTELELRDNALERIEGLDSLTQLTYAIRVAGVFFFFGKSCLCFVSTPSLLMNTCLFFRQRTLDLSYNGIRKIEKLEALKQVRRLFLANNKIKVIRNLDHLSQLTMLELGANRIRVGDEEREHYGRCQLWP